MSEEIARFESEGGRVPDAPDVYETCGHEECDMEPCLYGPGEEEQCRECE